MRFNDDKKNLLQSWGITIQTPYNANILYESERGLGNDGERIVKLYSENFEYKVECAEYYKVIELDKDMEIISEIIKRGKIEDVININNIRIIDSIKRDNINDYYKYLIITFDYNKKIYYIFERII